MHVLAVGAHPDDIELGCAGALMRHVAAGDQVTMLVMTSGDRGPQGARSRVSEQKEASRIIGAQLLWGHFDDGSIPHGRESVAIVDAAVRDLHADVVYVHAPADSHQDHVATSLATAAAARRTARVLYYQSPSTTQFQPNVFVDVEDTVAGKIDSLRAHWSQVTQCQFVDLEAVEAGCRYWGSRARISYAEPFETPRFVWDIVPSVAKTLAPPLMEQAESAEAVPMARITALHR
jgi:LmbE family N-acetylglucosaminyl deacetylase